jgi:hypothetical protein
MVGWKVSLAQENHVEEGEKLKGPRGEGLATGAGTRGARRNNLHLPLHASLAKGSRQELKHRVYSTRTLATASVPPNFCLPFIRATSVASCVVFVTPNRATSMAVLSFSVKQYGIFRFITNSSKCSTEENLALLREIGYYAKGSGVRTQGPIPPMNRC